MSEKEKKTTTNRFVSGSNNKNVIAERAIHNLTFDLLCQQQQHQYYNRTVVEQDNTIHNKM